MPDRPMQGSVPCRDCTRAVWILRRLGYRDTVAWGSFPDSPNRDLDHASHSNAKGQPLCRTYRSELAWLQAALPARVTVYVGHPVSGPSYKANIANAESWVRFLRRQSADQLNLLMGGVYYLRRPVISAPWLVAPEPDSEYPGGREAIIQDCRDQVILFDEFWAVGGKISEGMKAEMEVARCIRDLTPLGRKPPTHVMRFR